MKTQQVLTRTFAGQVIRQNHKTLMFSANDLANIFKGKNLAHWVNSDNTIRFCETIMLREGLSFEEVIHKSGKKRGDDSGTWVHPLLAVDLAMWLSPDFKYDVLKWVQDHLCLQRDVAGDSYKLMCDAIQTSYGNEIEPRIFASECYMIQDFAGIKTGSRNIATEQQLKRLNVLQHMNTQLLKKGVKSIHERRNRITEFVEMFDLDKLSDFTV